MIAGLDSSFSRPTPSIVSQAWAAGVRVWGGYIATNQAPGSFNLASPWDKGSFDVVSTLGSMPIAFCSGLDDPVALKQLAASWNVRLCLDVEGGIRGDGPWVDQWLQVSGAGLYGQNSPFGNIHYHAAAFHIGSYYPGYDPGKTWYGPLPGDGTPLGWQWQGDHQEFGLSVDRGWYDDWFGGIMLTQDDINAVADAVQARLFGPSGTAAYLTAITQEVVNGIPVGVNGVATQLPKILAAVKTPPAVDVNALATALATHPLTATLSDAERDAVASHVLQHLSKDTAAG